MAEVIRQAAAAHHYLVVFDDHTECPLYLGRSRRLASAAQRIVLYAKDRGCTFPGCTAPAYHSQVHHASADWADGGQTNITDETLACGPDNRRVKPGGWRTRKLIDSARLRGVRPGQERLVDPIRAFTPASPRRSRGLPARHAFQMRGEGEPRGTGNRLRLRRRSRRYWRVANELVERRIH